MVETIGTWNAAIGDFSIYVAVRWDGEDERVSLFKGTNEIALLSSEDD